MRIFFLANLTVPTFLSDCDYSSDVEANNLSRDAAIIAKLIAKQAIKRNALGETEIKPYEMEGAGVRPPSRQNRYHLPSNEFRQRFDRFCNVVIPPSTSHRSASTMGQELESATRPIKLIPSSPKST